MANEELNKMYEQEEKVEMIPVDVLEKVAGMGKSRGPYICDKCGREFQTITSIACHYNRCTGKLKG